MMLHDFAKQRISLAAAMLIALISLYPFTDQLERVPLFLHLPGSLLHLYLSFIVLLALSLYLYCLALFQHKTRFLGNLTFSGSLSIPPLALLAVIRYGIRQTYGPGGMGTALDFVAVAVFLALGFSYWRLVTQTMQPWKRASKKLRSAGAASARGDRAAAVVALGIALNDLMALGLREINPQVANLQGRLESATTAIDVNRLVMEALEVLETAQDSIL